MMMKSTKRNKRLAVMVGAALAFGTAYGMTAQTPFIPSAYADVVATNPTISNNTTNASDRVAGAEDAGNVENANITVDTGGEVKRATGGKSTGGNATNNSVTVQGTAKIGVDGVIGGYSQGTDGKADSNKVTITGGDIDGTVEGGRSTQGTADRNTVEVTTGDIDKTGSVAIMGGNGVKGAEGNRVTINSTDGTNNIKGDVIGGNSSRADAAAKVNNNTVTIMDGTITGTIVGAYANGAAGVTATGNAVDIQGGMIDASNANVAPATGIEGIRGAYSTGDVTGNAVSIGGSAVIAGAVYGGSSADATANGNSATISGGTISGAVYGGTSGASGGQATGNTVSVTGGAITARTTEACAVIGGYGDGLADGNKVTIANAQIRGTDAGSGSVTGGASTTSANNNSVTIKAGADIADDVSGGSSDTDAANNQVVMEAGAVGGDIRGGHAVDGSATSNILTIQGGAVSGQVAGGRTDSGLGGEASGNKLYMTGGTVKAAAAGYAAGTGNVTANELYMTGGTVNGSGAADGVAAGYAVYGNAEGNVLHLAGGTVDSPGGVSGGASGTGSAADNTLIMTGGTVAKSAQGGYSLGGEVTGNTFKMSGGTLGKSAYGGISESGKAEGNTLEISGTSHIMKNAVGGEGQTEANNNTVKITGGTIDSNVYGGFGHKDGTLTTAAGNQIFISGSPIFSNTTDIVAARVSTAVPNKYENLTSGGNNISFGAGDALTGKVNVNAITADTIAVNSLGGAALNAGSAAITAKDVNASTVDVSKIALDRVVGEDFTILEATNALNVTGVNDGTVTMGTTLQQDVGRNGNKIGFKAGTRRVQGQTTHAVLNAQAGIAALAAGNTLIDRAVTGLDAFGAADDPREWRAFMYTGGGRAEYDTGSSVTNHTWSGIVGIGRHDQRKDGGALNYGLFYEYGRGNYTTDDSAGRGDGNAHYMGGGLLARNETANGFYYEGSFRAGRMTNDARNILHDPGTGRAYGYNENSDYWGFHLGLGKIMKYTNDRSLDLYGRYYFNHVDGISFDAGGHYDLDAVKTSLIRLGARYNFWKDSGWTSYGGLAYEYEMDGEAGGTADGFAIRTADLGGSSAMFELGIKMQPDKYTPWGVDLNLTLHAGQRKGIMGGAMVSYSF